MSETNADKYRMDVQTYNKVFLPQWTTASLFIRNLQLTLEGKCDKESLRQLQIIGWNEETKKFVSDVLNLYKEKVLDELSSISNKDYFDKKVEEALKENTMDNYIMINGKKIELTEEQLKQLGIKRNNPFDRVNNKKHYYLIGTDIVMTVTEDFCNYDQNRFDVSNYFNDEYFAKQVMLHQQLYRKLLKYAYDNNAEVTEEDWKNISVEKYKIQYSYHDNHFIVIGRFGVKDICDVPFKDGNVAELAIKDIIEPFMKEHPEFIW